MKVTLADAITIEEEDSQSPALIRPKDERNRPIMATRAGQYKNESCGSFNNDFR